MAQTDLIAKLKLDNKNAKETISQLKQDIKALKAELKQVGQQAQGAGSSRNLKGLGDMGKVFGDLIGKGGGLTNMLGKVGGALGVAGVAFGAASVAGKTFNLMMQNSQEIGDAYEKVQTMANSALDYFGKCLAQCDFSNFINGLINSINEAGILADKLDEIQTDLQVLGVLSTEYHGKISKLQADLADETDVKKRKALLEEMQKLTDEYAAEAKINSDELIDAGLRTALQSTGIIYDQLDAKGQNYVETMIKGTKAQRKEVEDLGRDWKRLHDIINMSPTVDAGDGKVLANPGWNQQSYDDARKRIKDPKYKYGNLAYQLSQQQDNEGGPMQQARQRYQQGIQLKYETEGTQRFINRQKKRDDERIKREKETQAKLAALQAKYDKKGQDAHGNWIYKEDAKTITEMTSNINYLKEEANSIDPGSERFHDIAEEITLWQRKIDDLDFGQIGSLSKLQAQLNYVETDLGKLAPGTDEWNDKLREAKALSEDIATLQMTRMEALLDENDKTLQSMSDHLSLYNAKLQRTVKGTKEWKDLKKQIRDIEKETADWLSGSVGELEWMKAGIEDQLTNENLSISARIKLEDQKADIQKQIDQMTDTAYIKAPVKTGHQQRVEKSKQNAQTRVDDILEARNRKINPISAKEAKKEIAEINAELAKIGLDPIIVHVETDFEKEFAKFEQGYGTVMNAAYAFDNLAGSIENIKKVGDEGGSVLEMLFAVMQFGEGVIAAVNAVMEIANMLGIKKAATDAAGTGAMTAKAAAATEEMATDSASIAPKMTEAAANKVLTSSLLELASASIFAAHASIPFAGVGIATGMVSGMLAAMAAAKASIAAMAAFANGGIVDGTALTGDNTLIRANKGEMVLNQTQQGNLFRMIDSGGLIGNMAIQFKLRGEDLVGSVSNHSSKHGITNGKRVQMR